MGRRSKKDPKIVQLFLDKLLEGKSAVQVCRDNPDLPNFSTIWRWMQTDAELRERYRIANEIRAQHSDQRIEDIQAGLSDIVDKVNTGEMTKEAGVIAVHAAKLQIDTEKWRAGKLYPKLYGAETQRVEVNHTATLVDELKVVQQRIEQRKAEKALEARDMVVEGRISTTGSATDTRDENENHSQLGAVGEG